MGLFSTGSKVWGAFRACATWDILTICVSLASFRPAMWTLKSPPVCISRARIGSAAGRMRYLLWGTAGLPTKVDMWDSGWVMWEEGLALDFIGSAVKVEVCIDGLRLRWWLSGWRRRYVVRRVRVEGPVALWSPSYCGHPPLILLVTALRAVTASLVL